MGDYLFDGLYDQLYDQWEREREQRQAERDRLWPAYRQEHAKAMIAFVRIFGADADAVFNYIRTPNPYLPREIRKRG